jgi:hypothetical protein
MNPVRRVPNLKPQARPFKAPLLLRSTVTSLPHPRLPRFKAAANVIKISPPNKIQVSQKSFAMCKPLQPGFPTQMAKPLQRLIPRRRRVLRPHLAISKPTLISLPPLARKTRHPLRVPPLHRKIILRRALAQPSPIHHRQPQLQPYRLLQPQLLFQTRFQPFPSFPASALFEARPTLRAPPALTFRLAA